MLIFKNTYDDPENGQPKHFQIRRADQNAPTELYFVHMEIKSMNSLPTAVNRITNLLRSIRCFRQQLL